MIPFTVQRNSQAKALIISSESRECGYMVTEMKTEEEIESSHATLHDLYVFALMDSKLDHTIRYFIKAEEVVVTPDTQFTDCVIFPCLQADLMLEEHGFYAAYRVTHPQDHQQYHPVPVSQAEYYGLTPPEERLPILYFGKE